VNVRTGRSADGPGDFAGPARLGSVAIAGAGQVGTMLGMALGASGAADRVDLFDRDGATLDAALARGAGKSALTSLTEVLERDTVIIALPVPEIVRILEAFGGSLRPGRFVIDTGGAKVAVVEAMRRFVPRSVHALGGHPIAGTEHPGPAGAEPERLQGAAFVLSPVREDAEALARGRELARAVGAEPYQLEASTHDRVVARTSHLPHLVAFALLRAAADGGDDETVRTLASTGFASATRLAASDPEMVAGFLSANAHEVQAALADLRAALDRVDVALAGDPAALAGLLAAYAGAAR